MAQVPRTVPVPVTATLQATRHSAAVRPSASEQQPVEELSPQVETRFESDQYLSAEYGKWEQGQGNQSGQQQDGQRGPYNLVTTPTKLFADVFVGDREIGSAGGDKTVPNVKGFTNVVSKAISTYETNAKVISGTVEQRGSQLSFLL